LTTLSKNLCQEQYVGNWPMALDLRKQPENLRSVSFVVISGGLESGCRKFPAHGGTVHRKFSPLLRRRPVTDDRRPLEAIAELWCIKSGDRESRSCDQF
jgi:hypothetical protein